MENNREVNEVVSRLESIATKFESTIVERKHDELKRYRCELENVIDVLKKTKGSFHSKQLRDLRERIEKVLQVPQ